MIMYFVKNSPENVQNLKNFDKINLNSSSQIVEDKDKEHKKHKSFGMFTFKKKKKNIKNNK